MSRAEDKRNEKLSRDFINERRHSEERYYNRRHRRSRASLTRSFVKAKHPDSIPAARRNVLAAVVLAGVGPLTQFDAAATPMTASFTTKPNFTPYAAITPTQSLDELNTTSSPMAAQSAKMNFGAADVAPERQLNEAIWKSVKGADSTMPGPRQAMPDSEDLGGN